MFDPTLCRAMTLGSPEVDIASLFFSAVNKELRTLPFIAEDLGLITPDFCALPDQFQLPGTRILQFAFDGNAGHPYLPHNYVPNTVVYTGTHHNATTRGWFETLPEGPETEPMELLEAAGRESRRGGLGTDPPGLVFSGWPRYGATSGFAESGGGGADEPAWQHGRQLALALH
jgi:hypothetical protein